MTKEWTSTIYAFFDPTPCIVEIDGQTAHEFKCSRRGCKALPIRRYLDTKDAKSTGNMCKHACACWGDEIVRTADGAHTAAKARKDLVPSLRSRSITAIFE